MTKIELAQALAPLFLTFEKEPSPELIAAYFAVLHPLPADKVMEACMALMRGDGRDKRSLAFMPRPGEIYQAAIGSREARAESEWVYLVESIGEYSTYKAPPISDPATQRALTAIGGWRMICTTPYSQQHWLKKSFMESYGLSEEIGHAQIGNDEATEVFKRIRQHEM